MVCRGLFLLVVLLSTVLAYTELSIESLSALGHLHLGDRLSTDDNDLNHLKHFNRTRVPGGEGSLYVREYIKSHFSQIVRDTGANWVVQEDVFEQRGFNFSNIVATISPHDMRNTKYLVLSAHYDSKIDPIGFIGAIDSIASCCILLDIAESLSPSLRQAFSDEGLELDIGLKIVFFDGEEAIEQWSNEDSIYGAKHLHAEWKKKQTLGSIDLFVLLDLLGAKDTNYVPSYFQRTQDSYAALSMIEKRLEQIYPDVFPAGKGFLAAPSYSFEREYYGVIGDDHLPFLQSGVPILHMITHPFPSTWHTINDDLDSIDIVAVHHWCMLFAAFTLEYLDVPLSTTLR